ncbi:MAG: selenocysteine-specific elongation factor, partial [Candidatus Azotimanducaceae bacterium]
MIIALAGHVDHGKTSLVHALSGVNTDRLEEEKRRGLTIDLGFAYIDEGRIGFVDVPGHHKFIHNMVAGVASDQTAMLVIAADDGPMPQSKEHLDILGLLGVNQGMVVMTKTDRVTEERCEACEQEIRALVENTFLATSPIFQTSIENAESYEPLKAHINQLAAENDPASDGLFRLAIDRRFTVKGSGVVVTGTIHNGTVKVDDSLFHFPSGSSVRVR